MGPLNYTALEDQVLVVLIAHAQTGALDELYRRYHRLLFSLALNIVANRSIAEEITLDVFVQVWQKAHTYQTERAQVNTWLVSITRNRAIDHLRRQTIRPDHNAVSWADVPSGLHPTAQNTPESTTELRLTQQRVRAAIEQLPKEQQNALFLAYFKGYSHRQISESLNLPLGTVKTRIRLGMEKLRILLLNEETDNDKSDSR